MKGRKGRSTEIQTVPTFQPPQPPYRIEDPLAPSEAEQGGGKVPSGSALMLRTLKFWTPFRNRKELISRHRGLGAGNQRRDEQQVKRKIRRPQESEGGKREREDNKNNNNNIIIINNKTNNKNKRED
eukprot:757377-Hanusia_phi.AAC.2